MQDKSLFRAKNCISFWAMGCAFNCKRYTMNFGFFCVKQGQSLPFEEKSRLPLADLPTSSALRLWLLRPTKIINSARHGGGSGGGGGSGSGGSSGGGSGSGGSGGHANIALFWGGSKEKSNCVKRSG
jgi:uncharacterized membrane protein YgcG